MDEPGIDICSKFKPDAFHYGSYVALDFLAYYPLLRCISLGALGEIAYSSLPGSGQGVLRWMVDKQTGVGNIILFKT